MQKLGRTRDLSHFEVKWILTCHNLWFCVKPMTYGWRIWAPCTTTSTVSWHAPTREWNYASGWRQMWLVCLPFLFYIHFLLFFFFFTIFRPRWKIVKMSLKVIVGQHLLAPTKMWFFFTVMSELHQGSKGKEAQLCRLQRCRQESTSPSLLLVV